MNILVQMFKNRIFQFIQIYRKINGIERLGYSLNAIHSKVNALERELYELRYSQFQYLPYLPSPDGGAIGKRFIVSLTSYRSRIFTTAPYAICSIFQQSILPDKIILWLSEKEISPQLKILQERGLEIRFCEDFKSYKKLLPALKEFPNDVIITADDDVYYPRNWFAKFKAAYEKNQENIYCQYAHEIATDENGNILPYAQWGHKVSEAMDGKKIFPVGVGGILYPPGSLSPLVCDLELSQRLAETGDDIWFWAMAKLNGTKHILLEGENTLFTEIQSDGCGIEPLWTGNIIKGKNDSQLKAVLDKFPEIKKKFLEEIS